LSSRRTVSWDIESPRPVATTLSTSSRRVQRGVALSGRCERYSDYASFLARSPLAWRPGADVLV
jgi:hypothetical protein